MQLNWDKLRIFHAVAEAGSFTHAMDTLHISQSAISRQISTLEESLGVSVFHRHARGLILTEQGELLLESTKDVYRKLSMIESQISDTKKQAAGPLRITVAGFLGSTWLAPKINEFRKLYPQLKLTFILDNKVYDLGMREADAAIRLYEPLDPGLVKRKIAEISFGIYASRDYLNNEGIPKKAADLQNHTLIGYAGNVAQPHQHTGWLFETAGVKRESDNNVLEINSMYAIHQTVKCGTGIACLPDFMVKGDKDLVAVLPELKQPKVDVFFVYPEERRNATRISVFRDFLLKQMVNEIDV